MPTYKSISSTTPLNQIAKRFSLAENFTGSHHLRAKQKGNDVIISNKHFSLTKFAQKLGPTHKIRQDAREKIARERKLFKDTLTQKLSEEYSPGTAEGIHWRDAPALRGFQVEAMQSHAAVACALDEMGLEPLLKELGIQDTAKEQLLFDAREHVYALDANLSAKDRTYAAKIYLAKALVAMNFPDRGYPLESSLKQLTDNFYTVPCLRSPDARVVKEMIRMYGSESELPTIAALERAVIIQKLQSSRADHV